MTLQKLRTLAQDSKPSPGVVEEGGLRTQGHLQLQRELEASAGYMRPQGVGCFFGCVFCVFLFICFVVFFCLERVAFVLSTGNIVTAR